MALRLTISGEAEEAIQQMMSTIKQSDPDVSINSSELAAWIVLHFKKSYFDKLRSRIIKEHFNPKSYLRNNLKGTATSEEVAMILQKARERMSNGRHGPKAKETSKLPISKNGPMPE